jgi:hypothetical protein
MVDPNPTGSKIVWPKFIVQGGDAWNQDLRLHLLGSVHVPFGTDDAWMN